MHLNALFNNALACHHVGQLHQAARLYRQILNIHGNHAQASNNLGVIFLSFGRLNEAVGCFHKALNVNADFFEARLNLARAYKELGRYREAAENFRSALAIKPDHISAYLDLSFLYHKLGDSRSAIKCCRQALALDSESVEAHNNLGNALMHHGDPWSAIESYNTALQIRPDRADIYYNLANALKSAGRLYSAIEHYQRALTLNPDFIDARWNLSHVLLLGGNFQAGWREYECRFKLPNQKDIYPFRLEAPRWEGDSFIAKRLLVHDEQGFGDTLQFIRFLPFVKALGGTVIFETRNPLLKLLKGFPGIDELVPRSDSIEPAADFDLYIPLMSLPALFDTRLSTVPSQVPYLYADPKVKAQWRTRLEGSDLKVGIVWAGNPGHANDQHRSCELEMFRVLTRISGVKLIGLQSGPGALQVQRSGSDLGLINLGDEFEDFSDTAAAISVLDLVIAVDTAVAHLAGAMGKPVWLLLPYSPDWRWLTSRGDSPWYPTMRLYRQPLPGNWKAVFQQVNEDLSRTAAKYRRGSN